MTHCTRIKMFEAREIRSIGCVLNKTPDSRSNQAHDDSRHRLSAATTLGQMGKPRPEPPPLASSSQQRVARGQQLRARCRGVPTKGTAGEQRKRRSRSQCNLGSHRCSVGKTRRVAQVESRSAARQSQRPTTGFHRGLIVSSRKTYAAGLQPGYGVGYRQGLRHG
jgi:hypothetical protein